MSDDPYMECPVYAEHGACSCSTGVYGNTCRLPGGLGEPECEEHHIALTPHIVTLGPEDEHALPEQLVCRLCFLEDAIYEQGHRGLALRADNHRLRAAIGRHRDRIMSLGHDGKGKHGSEWDRELWSVLYDFLRSAPCNCEDRRGELDGRCVDCGRRADPYEGRRDEMPCAWCHEPESMCRCDHKREVEWCTTHDKQVTSRFVAAVCPNDIGCKIEQHDAREARLLYESKPFEADRDDAVEELKCAQETAGFGPPCSDPMCEACRG